MCAAREIHFLVSYFSPFFLAFSHFFHCFSPFLPFSFLFFFIPLLFLVLSSLLWADLFQRKIKLFCIFGQIFALLGILISYILTRMLVDARYPLEKRVQSDPRTPATDPTQRLPMDLRTTSRLQDPRQDVNKKGLSTLYLKHFLLFLTFFLKRPKFKKITDIFRR